MLPRLSLFTVDKSDFEFCGPALVASFTLSLWFGIMTNAFADETLKLSWQRIEVTDHGEARVEAGDLVVDPKKVAVIVCDMWDDHWCKSAAKRVEEMAVPLNKVLHAARKKGAFIIHSPSTVTEFYKDTAQRKLARESKFHVTPNPLPSTERWGTKWCWPDPNQEGVLPIDDSDMGCSCSDEKCRIRDAWKRQIATIDIVEGDAITDDGQETWNLLKEREIDTVVLCGVHLNMCVLGRPFGIRQLVNHGLRVYLMRDMTDTMYNPERPPGVDHFTGTDLVINHVATYWCGTITSDQFVGGVPFRFKEDRRERTYALVSPLSSELMRIRNRKAFSGGNPVTSRGDANGSQENRESGSINPKSKGKN